MENSGILEQALQDGNILRQLNALIVAHLRHYNLLQAIFNDTEEFVISIDEGSNEVITWDARTAEKVAKWPSYHNGVPRWIEHSPVESVFDTCGTDRSVRFWKESV